MAYINQEMKKSIAAKLKELLKGTGFKVSLSVKHSSSLVCTIKSGPIDFISEAQEIGACTRDGHITIGDNERRIEKSIKNSAILLKILAVLKSEGWYNKSESMIDYFDIAYYIDINIGSWDKPYQYIDEAA